MRGKNKGYSLRQVENNRTKKDNARGNRPQRISIPSNKAAKGKRRKNVKRQRIIFISVAVFLTAVCAVAVLLFKNKNKAELSVLQGTWRYDEYTEYEFDGNGNGCMCVDEKTHFKFRYNISGNTVSMDFVLDYVVDCEYEFSVNGEQLTLIGGKGTATPGQEYVLVRE